MATIETLNVELADGGGTITLTIEADFLTMPISEFEFVRELAAMMRSYGGMSPQPVTAVASKLKADAATKRAADTERKRKQRSSKQPSTGRSKYDYAEVARVANAALHGALSMSGALADRFHVSVAMGSWLIIEARKQGFDIPARAAKPAPSNVIPIAKPGPDPTARAFTPDDTLKLLEGG